MDTFKSTLETDKLLEKTEYFRRYIGGNWDRIFDWKKKVENPPKDARGMGAKESNQRYISFRMKKRGMHLSIEDSEAMVKIKQGILNKTLRSVYLKDQKRSGRKQRDVKKVVRMTEFLHHRSKTRHNKPKYCSFIGYWKLTKSLDNTMIFR